MRDPGKIPFSKDRLTSLVHGDRIAGRMARITLVGILSGPEKDDPLRAFILRATSNSETEFKTIDLKHEVPRKALKSQREVAELAEQAVTFPMLAK